MSAELLPTATPGQTRAALARVLLPYRGFALASLLTLVAATVVGLAAPRLLGHIVDLVVGGESSTEVTVTVLVLGAVAIGQGALNAAGTAMVAKLGQTVTADVRQTVLRRVLGIPSERIERSGTGDIAARLSGDVEVVNEATSTTLPVLTDASLNVVLTAVAMALLDWRFAVAGLLAVPFQAFAVRWYLRTAVPVIRTERRAEGERAQQLMDSIDGSTTVRAFRLEPEHLERVRESSDAARLLSIRMAAMQRRFFGKLNGGELAGLLAILLVGFLLVRSGGVSIGAASAAALYFHRLFDQFNAVLGSFDTAQSAGAAFARLVGVADMPEEPERADGAIPSDGSVRVRALNFSYLPGHNVLSDVDLDAAAGERVAIVGASGAGKTTLVKLIAGIAHPDHGEIALGGVDADELSPATLRRSCALISQEVHVFTDTLAADLRLAKEDASEEELSAALGTVNATGWVRALPDGLDTVLGKGGHRLTSTQAQQLALARLVLANPPLAILDEATAEAGSVGARALEAAADKALAGRTALVVAHRLTQAARADRIVVLDAGRVVETGTHHELSTREGGVYAKLWSAWSGDRV